MKLKKNVIILIMCLAIGGNVFAIEDAAQKDKLCKTEGPKIMEKINVLNEKIDEKISNLDTALAVNTSDEKSVAEGNAFVTEYNELAKEHNTLAEQYHEMCPGNAYDIRMAMLPEFGYIPGIFADEAMEPIEVPLIRITD